MTHNLTSWIWRHLHLALPDDWEMLRYSRQPKQGDCLFADREMFRLELLWQQVEGTPDFDRMLKDYEEKLVADHGMERPLRRRHGVWHGLAGRFPELYASRYGRYIEPLESVVELVFLWDEEPDTKLEDKILDSVRHIAPDDAGRQRWRACGIDCRPAADLELDACHIRPANMAMSFTTGEPSDIRMEHYERLGLVDFWLVQPLREWLGAKIPKQARNVRQSHRTVHGHTVETVTGEVPAGFPKVTAKPFGYRACAWTCPADHCVYLASVIDRDPPSLEELIGTRLRCCGQLPERERAAA